MVKNRMIRSFKSARVKKNAVAAGWRDSAETRGTRVQIGAADSLHKDGFTRFYLILP